MEHACLPACQPDRQGVLHSAHLVLRTAPKLTVTVRVLRSQIGKEPTLQILQSSYGPPSWSHVLAGFCDLKGPTEIKSASGLLCETTSSLHPGIECPLNL